MHATSRHTLSIWKRHFVGGVLALLVVLLAACATGPRVLRASLTSFQEWPAEIEKTYAMVAPVGASDNLEQKTYQRLVVDELTRQGFRELANNARLAVTPETILRTTSRPST